MGFSIYPWWNHGLTGQSFIAVDICDDQLAMELQWNQHQAGAISCMLFDKILFCLLVILCSFKNECFMV